MIFVLERKIHSIIQFKDQFKEIMLLAVPNA